MALALQIAKGQPQEFRKKKRSLCIAIRKLEIVVVCALPEKGKIRPMRFMDSDTIISMVEANRGHPNPSFYHVNNISNGLHFKWDVCNKEIQPLQIENEMGSTILVQYGKDG